MSTLVKPDVDASALEHLDFTPKCDVTLVMCVFGRDVPIRHCRRKASWMAVLPCCGYQTFSCEPHHDGRGNNECGGCGHYFSLAIGWRWIRP